MKIVQINTFPYKATGSVMMGIHNVLLEHGNESYVVWGRGRAAQNKFEIEIGDRLGTYWHGIYTRITDKTGFESKRATKKLIARLDEIKPNIIHLHNLHGYYINIEMLFDYLRENKIKTVWTLHDCWAITGHCAYFDMIGCSKWKTGCHNCEQKRTYPASMIIDNSAWNWRKKKDLFTGLDLQIVTVSKWLAGVVRQSYLKEYPISVIYNGINLNIFKSVQSNFRRKYHLEEKFIILGVASEWTERKGLHDFIKLASLLDNNYAIVLVGLTDQQISETKGKVLGLRRTSNIAELVEIYSSADIFFNASVEETMGMTTIEAMACGTLPIVYNATAMPEIIDEWKDLIFEKQDIAAVANKCKEVKANIYDKNALILWAKKYELNKKMQEYVDLYNRMCENGKRL